MRAMRTVRFVAAVAAACAIAATTSNLRGATPETDVDKLFARWTSSTPGCAVGVARDGAPVLTKAYGMADLEHDVPNTPDTIFEAGSVSKQFTAAAVLLLAREGKLSLDDPARTYVPELPDYPAPVTIRQMLTHTSGLRDWGNVAGITGWPRTTRVHTHAHVLEILSRQKALNFTPGTRWSYSNSGFNLAAIIVSRVSGMPFAEFTRQRLFAPLAMTRTSWRDDYTRVVKGRAIAYSEEKDGFHTEMPFENVHGNGGLLTTVGDLLKWNEHYVNATTPEDKAWVARQQEIGRFSDGRQHDYAFGLWINDYKGVKNVYHSGSTAGYRAHLNRFPDAHLSVAVLCNVTTGDATRTANAVSDIYLADRLKPQPAPKPARPLTADEARDFSGLYRNTVTGLPVTVEATEGSLRLLPNTTLVLTSGAQFIAPSRTTWTFDGRGGVRSVDPFGRVDTFERVPPARPTSEDLRAFEGTYDSDEAETTLTAKVEADALVITRRPDTRLTLTPIYADAFRAQALGTLIFRRDGTGRVTALSVIQDRVWDLRFTRRQDRQVGQARQDGHDR
jgi:CubicO group peptidase (beta-lactamase class C family)